MATAAEHVLKKEITKETVDAFPNTKAFAEVKGFIEACAAAVEGVPLPPPGTAPAPSPLAGFIVAMRDGVLATLRRWVAEIPLQDMKAQRFGNKAFRDFLSRLKDDATLLGEVVPTLAGRAAAPPTLEAELHEYLSDSFGNQQRIDFGTGHELHFIVLMYLAVKYALPAGGEENEHDCAHLRAPEVVVGLRDLVLLLFRDYIDLCRTLQHHYSLEPAGSHGVWGLDDYHHAPLIFGASQLVGKEPAILPKHVTERVEVEAHRSQYLYFDMIGWIHDHKRGPFHEHSPVLYNVSGIDEWERIRRGMIKMYAVEVMSRFAVVQHFLTGPCLPLE